MRRCRISVNEFERRMGGQRTRRAVGCGMGPPSRCHTGIGLYAELVVADVQTGRRISGLAVWAARERTAPWRRNVLLVSRRGARRLSDLSRGPGSALAGPWALPRRAPAVDRNSA